MAKKKQSPPAARAETESDATGEMFDRIVYAMLRGAVRLAARWRLSMHRFATLARCAYFDEVLRGTGDMNRVAQRLDISRRTVYDLKAQLKSSVTEPERRLSLLRRILEALRNQSASRDELVTGPLADADPEEIHTILQELFSRRWIRIEPNGDYAREETLHTLVHEDLSPRLDAVHAQLDVITGSVYEAIVVGNNKTARGRSWTFAASKEDITEFIDTCIRRMRREAVDIDEAALTDPSKASTYGVTLAIAPMNEDGN